MAFLVFFALVVIAPFVFYPIFVMKVLCFALFVTSLNLLIGYGGLLSFGHAAFFGTGAYISAYTARAWGVTPELAIMLGTAAAAFIGFIFGALAIRRQGFYFAMITLAFGQMIFFIAVQAPFTSGEDGIQAVPRGVLFGVIPLTDDMTLYAVVAAITVAAFLMICRTIHSPFGQVVKAIRDNENRVISLGYHSDQNVTQNSIR